MSIDPTTGAITGHTTAVGDHNITLTASNLSGTSPSKVVTVSVTAEKPLFDLQAINTDISNISGLKLWLDASDLTSAGASWSDKSNNGNNAAKTGSPSIISNFQNGNTVMHYTGDGQRHTFNMINDIRTVFWIISQDVSVNGSGYRFVLSDTTKHPHWHNNNNGRFWGSHTASQVKGGVTRLNGNVINGETTSYPNSLAILSVQTTSNSDADCFGYDRSTTTNQWRGKLGEILIYNTALSGAEILTVEAYLAKKWGIGSVNTTEPKIVTSAVGSNSATATATLLETGGTDTTLEVFYGTADKGETVIGWDSNSSLPDAQNPGNIELGMSGLTASTSYVYRIRASNSAGSTWSDAVSFTTGATPNTPALSVSTPTVVGTSTATAKGNLLSFDGTTNPNVTLYYGPSDGNQTAENWSSNANLSTKPVGSLNHNLTSLTAGTTYFYRYFATVTISGTAYSSFSDLGSFTTLGLPKIETPGATGITKTSATLNAKLTFTNGNDSNVTFYWGDNNGSNNGNHNQWDNPLASSTNQGVGVVGQSISGLSTGTTYYYTAKAVNAQGTAWATVKTFVPANTAINKYSIPDLALWLDATDLDGNDAADSVANGSALPSWTDKSVTPKTVNQTSSTEQPVVISNAIGGKSVVRFDGNGDVLNVSSIRTEAGAYSIYAITQRISESGDTSAHLASEPTWALIPSATADSFSAQVAKNSASSGASLTNIKLGKSGSSTTNDFGGDLAELLIFSRQLNSTEEQKVEGYLAHKWGVANTLDSNHSYKDVPPVFDNKPLIGNMSTATITTGQNVSIQIPASRNPSSWSATGLATGLSINNSGVISGTTTFIGDFNATVTAINSDGNDSKQISFSVTKGQRIITWDQNFTNITYGDAPITLNATATGTGDLNYTSSDSDIIEINGTSAIIRGGGSVTLTATAVENTTAFAAIPVTKIISVAKAPLTITGQDLTLPVGTSIPDLNYTATGWKHNDASLGVAANPAAFSNLALWLDAADSSTLFSDHTFNTSATTDIGGWKDKSGNNNHATQATSSRKPTYTVSNSLLNNKSSVSSSSENGSIGLDLPSTSLQEIFVVAYYKDGSDNSFDNYNTLISGTGTYGQYRIMGHSGSSNWFTGSDRLNDGGNFKNGATSSSNSALPMSATLLRFASSVARTQTRGILYNTQNADRGWIGGVGQIIGLSTTSSTSDRQKIEGYLAHKWGLAGSLPSNHSHKTVSLTRGPVVTTNATNSSSAGTYYIRPGAAASSKYSFTYADGDLVLSSLTAQTIAWDQNFSGVGVGQTVDLNASATSNLSVIYSVSDTSVAELAVTNQSSLHAWYKLDETGGVDAIDSSVYGSSAGHKGSLRNATGTPWNSGKFANAITLDGSNDHIRDYNFQGITGNARRTIALWFKTSTANKPLIQYGASGSGTLFKLSLNGSGAAVLDLGGTTLTTSTTGLANGAWHHVAATIPANGNTGGAKLYINGTVTNGSGSTAINTATTADLVIGRDGTSGSAYFNGQIDDVRLYGAELNATLISQLYGNGNGDFNRLTVKAAGTVTITATQPGNNSYAQAPSSSITATFDKSDQTIAFTPITDKSVGDFDFSPTAVASSGLDITFTSSDSQVAEILGTVPNQTIQIRGAGTATITASQGGNGAYNTAPSVTQTVTVGYFNLQANSLPGLRLWLDANNINGDATADTLADGSAITQWIDQSGNTNNAGQGTANAKPTYAASALNNMGVVRFTAAQSLDITSSNDFSTVIAVMNQASGQSAETKPLGSNIFATTSAGKFGTEAPGECVDGLGYLVPFPRLDVRCRSTSRKLCPLCERRSIKELELIR